MRRFAILLTLGAMTGGLPLIAGCEREVKHEKTEKTREDGTKVKEEKKVTRDADGNTTVTEEKKVDQPNGK